MGSSEFIKDFEEKTRPPRGLYNPAEIAAIDYQAKQTMRIEIAKNVATNGRWFCALLVAIALYMDAPALALVATFPIGLSVLGDPLPAGKVKAVTHAVIYIVAIAAAVLVFLNAW